MADVPRITPGKPVWPHHRDDEPPHRRPPAGEDADGRETESDDRPVDTDEPSGPAQDEQGDNDGHIDVFV